MQIPVLAGAMVSLDESKRLQRKEARRVRLLIRDDGVAKANDAVMGEIGGTKETKAKMQPHAVERLLASGFLDESDQIALDDIAGAYMSITSSSGYACGNMERVDSGRSEGPQDHLAGQQHRYSKWRDELKRYSALDALPIIIDLAVEGISIKKMCSKHRMGDRKVKRLIRQGLDLYESAMKRKN